MGVQLLTESFFCIKVRFINFERTKLPEEILKHNMEEKRKYFSDIHLDVEKSDAEVQVRTSFLFTFLRVLSIVHVFCALELCAGF